MWNNQKITADPPSIMATFPILNKVHAQNLEHFREESKPYYLSQILALSN